MENNNGCSKCGSTDIKQGKIAGISSLQSLNSRTGLGGSELLVNFCNSCGEVTSIKVKNPSAIK
ncbi:hypothetical protein [Clostridium estertheticum]|uniref:hypothetical protein n=1 Tax=Clostridium estertheticum TaxID=238834 RepID=UPI00124D6D96|nr:hypothetical protein [Clostridium estertheticum]MBU3171698.1 hypothetical protein [Clostridium estertheticum]MBU3186858.1 hypothetical protein [Clostridium estertheticum]MBW9173463.1 hypothetical protein [Clostridium estertheticum]MBX4260436.1 hypothetical protein [Clostridium estertheticum]MBX4265479.1 hypothetical protein [Clostridium estertheticum]